MKLGSGFFLRVVPAILYVVAVFYGGSIPATNLPGTEITWGDKVLHALAFGGMQLAVFRAVYFFTPDRDRSFAVRVALVVTISVGGLLELYQAALPHRSAELLDWIADAVGALAVAAVLGLTAKPEPRANALGSE